MKVEIKESCLNCGKEIIINLVGLRKKRSITCPHCHADIKISIEKEGALPGLDRLDKALKDTAKKSRR